MQTKPDITEKIRRLSKRQLEVFRLQLQQTSFGSNATTSLLKIDDPRSTGGLLSSLSQNNLIEPAGREENKNSLKWTITPEVQKRKKEIEELVDKILDLYK